jgi:hypothetical protein
VLDLALIICYEINVAHEEINLIFGADKRDDVGLIKYNRLIKADL